MLEGLWAERLGVFLGLRIKVMGLLWDRRRLLGVRGEITKPPSSVQTGILHICNWVGPGLRWLQPGVGSELRSGLGCGVWQLGPTALLQ